MSRRQIIMMAVIFIAMFSFMLVVLFGDNGMVELSRLRRTHRNLLNDNDRLTQENLYMYRSIDRLQNDPSYVENIARRELGMIRSDELIFKFKDDENHP